MSGVATTFVQHFGEAHQLRDIGPGHFARAGKSSARVGCSFQEVLKAAVVQPVMNWILTKMNGMSLL